MPKMGIRCDYDLLANQAPGAQTERPCVVCNDPRPTYQWSDLYGEGMCIRCGCPYQLIGGGEEREKEADYPYLNLKDEWVPILTEYWQETRQTALLGRLLGARHERDDFFEWVSKQHPEMIVKGS